MARVSVIDDDDDTREVIRDLLENDGYVVDDVTTASSALDR